MQSNSIHVIQADHPAEEPEIVYSTEVTSKELEAKLSGLFGRVQALETSALRPLAAAPPSPTTGNKIVEGVKIIGAVLGVGVAIYLAFSAMVSSELSKQLLPIASDLATAKEVAVGLRRDIDRILAKQVFAQRKGDGAASPTIAEIKEAAEGARASRILVEPAAIERVAEPLFMDLDESKWSAAVALLNLRSFVNSTMGEANQNVVQTITPADHGKWFTGEPGKWVEILGLDLLLDAKENDLSKTPVYPAVMYDQAISRTHSST
jgi:hypothetical protein